MAIKAKLDPFVAFRAVLTLLEQGRVELAKSMLREFLANEAESRKEKA